MSIQLPETKKVNILIVDDDEDDFLIIKASIGRIRGQYLFNIEWCPDYDSALQKICRGEYDIYFIDFLLGARTGLDLIKESIRNNCEEPIILLTGVGNHEIDVQAMQAGAVDYLVKSELNAEKLERCIRYAMARHEYIKALKANEQKYRAIFEKSKDSVFVADMQLTILDANQTSTELFGYSRQDLLNMNLRHLMAVDEEGLMIEMEIAKKGIVLDREINFISKTGQVIQTTISLTREQDEKSNFYLQGIIHDISGLKKMEKANLQTEKFRATERLLRILAHELRNPLNNILLASDQLAQNDVSGPQVKLLDIIERNGKRINNMITELMDASRATEVVKEKVTIQSLIENSLLAVADRITLNRVELKKVYPDLDAFIMADANKLKIAFVNLIINAVEAVNHDTGTLSIIVRAEDSRYSVSITDNGAGISAEALNRIFEPNYTSKKNGMGLGLASVLGIVQSHGASIDVKSAVGKGTTFTITFEKL